MIYRFRNNILEIFLVVFFLAAITYILSFLYPYPYFAVGGLSGGASYDGEPDYFANIISGLLNGHSMDFLHPGIPITFMSKSILGLFADTYTVKEIVSTSRAFLVFTNFLMIYVGSRFILKQRLSNQFILLSLFLLFPAGFMLVDHLSPNGILFGLGALVIALGYKLEEHPIIFLLLFSLFLGLAIAIKFPSVILGLPFYISFLLGKPKIRTHLTLLLILSLAVLVFSFSLFVWPVLPFLPFILTHHNYRLSDFEIFYADPLLSMLLAFIFLSIVIYSIIKFRRIYKISYKKLYKAICFIFLVFLSIITLYKSIIAIDYLSFSYSLRNYIPLLGMIILFINNLIPKSIFKNLYHSSLILLIFLCLFSIKLYYNQASEDKALKFDTSFTNFYSHYSSDYDYLVFYPAGSFISKNIFLAWADYRYGDSRYSFLDEEKKLPFVLTEEQKRISILNTRKFDLEEPKNKISYQYFKSVSKNNYISRSQKEVALNQMKLQTPKEICSEIFDGYVKGNSALIVVPLSLHSYIANNASTDENLAYEYLQTLNNQLIKECRLNTEIKWIMHETQKFYLLSIF
jgi:hypothetical protein